MPPRPRSTFQPNAAVTESWKESTHTFGDAKHFSKKQTRSSRPLKSPLLILLAVHVYLPLTASTVLHKDRARTLTICLRTMLVIYRRGLVGAACSSIFSTMDLENYDISAKTFRTVKMKFSRSYIDFNKTHKSRVIG